ncbi:MAG: RagB/SusD family nutrient uptake outer membrane protein [Sphingobacteriales bacterium]|nr:MAG: RagB/SusD family nutrient uptake outer membrane protein [Sphingobacteriales bacterium]
MKTKYSITPFILVALFSLASCEKSGFLEIKPVNNVLTADVIKTPEDLQKLMIAAYNQMRSAGFLGGTALVAGDVLADDAVTTNSTFDWTQIVAHSMDLFNPPGRNTWNNTYNAINRANVAAFSSLADPILASASPEVANSLKADAAYIRALGHFHLVRLFGLPYSEQHKNAPGMGVPIRTRGTATIAESFDALPRSTVEEVYTQIINDLKFASTNLPANRNWDGGFATRDAAKALLAKVYFFKGDLANAIAEAKPLMNSNVYALDADITAKHARAELKKETKEVIFMLPSTAASDDSWGAIRGNYRSNNPAVPTPQWAPSPNLVAAYATNDSRFANLYLTKNGIVYSSRFNYNYMDNLVSGFDELLLIYAEALALSSNSADLAEAVTWLNKIESRAYGAPVTGVVAGSDGVVTAIRKERRLELALRGERLHELKRLRQTVRSDVWDSRKLLFQIPDNEQSGNPGITLN